MAPLAGLYIHIPFCKTKCPYCDFYSVTSPDFIPAYLNVLEKEAKIYQAVMPSNGGTGVSPVQAQALTCGYQNSPFLSFDTLYLGGGTPSWMGKEHLTELLKILRRNFILAPDSEITIEANPDDVTVEKLAFWHSLGINRLSLGAQSFNEAELRFLGRRHTAQQTLAALRLIRSSKIGNLGIDLIYGLPGQTLAAWVKNLDAAINFNPEHLSCYQLTLSTDTPMGSQAAAGKLPLLDEEAQREFFLVTDEILTGRGYLHYEVANFARSEKFICRHNLKYWAHVPYLGLGPAAHSFDCNRRWWNFSSLEQYCAALRESEAPVAGQEILTEEQLRLETLYLGFRTRDGVPLSTIHEHPHHGAVLAELLQAGLVRLHRDRVTATARGLIVADSLPLQFLA